MRDLGIREWTAIAALCFGVLLAFVFLDPAAGDSGPRPPLERGDAPPTATPVPVTAEPPSLLPTPENWNISFASIRNGEETIDAQRVLPELALQFDDVPFPDYRDDSWKVIVLTEAQLGAGSSVFTLHYDCEIRVFIDDREVASRGNPGAPEDLIVTFAHESGRFTIRIEATDTGGPFTLAYR
ncbi:MAG: hypothetical protein ACRDHF_06140 [Tepidiformaceae bacterium]